MTKNNINQVIPGIFGIILFFSGVMLTFPKYAFSNVLLVTISLIIFPYTRNFIIPEELYFRLNTGIRLILLSILILLGIFLSLSMIWN